MTDYIEIEGSIVQDFAQRTLDNLEYIELQYKKYQLDKTGTEVFEVTQLINSLLGLLVFPKEEFYEKELRPIPLKDLFWVKIKQDAQFPIHTDLRALIRSLRNSISHFHVLMDSNQNGEIDYLLMGDEWHGKQNWGGELSVDDLREFIKHFARGIIDGSLLK